MKSIVLTGQNLTLEEVALVCRQDAPVVLSEAAKQSIIASREVVDQIIKEGRVVYGVTTGFGKFSDVVISSEASKLLQKNLIITHAVGAGEPFPREVVRGMLLLRINNIAKGYSGPRMEVVETMVDMLNKGVTPVVPQKGSLGASGDLAPLSHMVLPMIGLGKAEYKGEILDGAEAMNRAGIPTIELSAKEGLALINGTQAMTASGALTVYDALELLKVADVAAALSFEAQNGIIDALDSRIHAIRPHQGQIDTARIVSQLLQDSKNTTRQGQIRVQDAYSLRCVPQVHGASKDAINFVKNKLDIEMNSVTDNPIILKDTMEVISGGNFHGQPMAIPFDYLGMAISEIANISERRLERLVNPALSGLPAFLTKHGGVNSGFMIVQYSAASLVSENKVLAHPASVDSIPSSANQEDHVSMGTTAARKACEILNNTRRVLAMEIMCACQAIDLRGNKGMGVGTQPAYETIRALVAPLEEDRPLYGDIDQCENAIIDGSLVSNVERHVSRIEF
ncbi:histidine ammonia-lyase [Oscillospiraceae bacterium LTW-04]|nr:histidine ammonia-lyase [Oscillospiraceae bacterium MB24-C1]